jgi:hypothetical protein
LRLKEFSRQTAISPTLRKRFDPIFLYVVRAFAASSTNSSSLVKALQGVRECLALADSGTAGAGDATAVPQLTALLNELQAHLPPGTVPLPSVPERSAPLSSPPVESPPERFSHTLALPFSLPTEEIATAPTTPHSLVPEPPQPPRIPFTRSPEDIATLPPFPFIPPAETIAPPPIPFVALPEGIETPSRPPVVPHPAPHLPPRAPPVWADPESANKVMSSLLAKLARLYARRENLLRALLTPWSEFANVDGQIDHAIQSVKWIGDAGSASAETALGTADGADEVFAAVVSLLQSKSEASVLAYLVTKNTLLAKTASGALLALRSSAEPSLLEQVESVGSRAAGEGRTSILTALADRGRLSADRLVALLDDPNDDIAARGAELLAWIGRSPADVDAVEVRLHRGPSDVRRCALLFAAVALGSARALQEIRRTLDAGAAVTPLAIDALAVAGRRDDSDRLLRLADRQPELAPLAVLAVGHLGNPAAVDAISGIDVEDSIRNRAIQTIRGDGTAGPPVPGVRLLYGRPWTLSDALVRLGAPDELLRSRPWYALEAVVRSGVRPNAVLDRHARSDVQKVAIARVRAAVDAQRPPVSYGSWLYFGRSRA